jgi:hypothetical protein
MSPRYLTPESLVRKLTGVYSERVLFVTLSEMYDWKKHGNSPLQFPVP